MSNYVIYCYTNTINNKKYIGQSKDPNRRCQPSNYKGSQKFFNAIQKYGWENFSREILEENLTLDEANKREEFYIQLYNTIEDGYNLKSGGLNCEYSIESKEKMSNSCKTKRAIICLETQEIFESAKEIEKKKGYANANIIACCRGKGITAYGMHWAYLEDYNTNNYIQKTDKRKRSVLCVETGEIFASAADAAKQMGVDRPNISACCAGRLKTAGGYHWQYSQEQNNAIKYQIK